MDPLPTEVITLLAQCPDETHTVILNTDGLGHWEVEVMVRYVFDVSPMRARSMKPARTRLAKG